MRNLVGVLMIGFEAIPARALSVRQPWAWAIIYGGKDVENRTWAFRGQGGPLAIHASAGMTKAEYAEFRDFCDERNVFAGEPFSPPPHEKLQRGGIIGAVDFVRTVKDSESPWFVGRWGLVLANPRPCEFVPVNGRLGVFNWRERLGSC